MSKAEDLAKKYCEGSSFEDACMERPAYIAGYHQAEEDLKLSWEDMFNIFHLVNEVLDDFAEGKTKEEVGEEVLKRFKDLRNERHV